jgi:hypothetical protein
VIPHCSRPCERPTLRVCRVLRRRIILVRRTYDADFGSARVKRYDLGGRVVQVVTLPANQVTSCDLAGPGLVQLVTTNRLREPPARGQQPHTGDLFVIALDTPGAAPFLYRELASDGSRVIVNHRRRRNRLLRRNWKPAGDRQAVFRSRLGSLVA